MNTRFFVSLACYLGLGLLSLSAQTPLPVSVATDNPMVLYSGRRDDAKPGEVRFGYSGARVRIAFEGTSIGMFMDSAKPNWVNVLVDGKRVEKLKVDGTGNYY